MTTSRAIFPDNNGRHSADGDNTTALPNPQMPTGSDEVAYALPDWDLLPPAEFIKRHR